MRLAPTVFGLCVALTVAPVVAADSTADRAAAVSYSQRVEARADLTLHDIYSAALALDPRSGLPEAYRQEAMALSARADSLLAGSPALALRHQTDEAGTNRGLRESEVNVELPLWRWGQRQASRDLAEAAAGYAEAHDRALELDIAGLVRDALWELALAEEHRNLARRAWTSAQTLEQDVRRRVQAGDLAEADLLLVRDETLGKLDEYLLATTGVRHAEKRYMALSGLPQRPADFSETASSLNTIADDHPLLSEARRRVERAQADLQRTRSAGSDSPQLIVGSRRDEEAISGITHDSIGIGLRLPFASASHAGPAIASANNQLAEAQSAQLALRRTLELALFEAGHTLETLRAELELAREQETLARENLRMARIAFDLGEIDLVQRLRVQTRAYTAERTLSLRTLQLQQAIARYNQAVGVTP
jgi:cobalt-zinc-cadmium efflux system outer membrane protein